jgi:hypothetical protein
MEWAFVSLLAEDESRRAVIGTAAPNAKPELF